MNLQRRLCLGLAEHDATLAQAGRAIDPGSGAHGRPWVDGYLAVSGPDRFVNTAMGCGVQIKLNATHLEQLDEISDSVGVSIGVTVSALTRADSVSTLQHGAFRPGDSTNEIAYLDPRAIHQAGNHLEVRSPIQVRGAHSLGEWQELSAIGSNHTSPTSRRSSDTYAAAAELAGSELLVAVEARTGRPLGCALLSTVGRTAILNGMSTLPTDRRRGVQGALIRHRVALARRAGCHSIVSLARVNSASARNLARHGFSSMVKVTTWHAARLSGLTRTTPRPPDMVGV